MPETTSRRSHGRPDGDAADDYALIETGYQAVRWHEPIIYERLAPGMWNEIVGEAEADVPAERGDVLARIPRADARDSRSRPARAVGARGDAPLPPALAGDLRLRLRHQHRLWAPAR